MGGGGSKPLPPPIITTDPFPTRQTLSNLSISNSGTRACINCDLSLDTRVTTSSVKLVRDYGDTTQLECGLFQKELDMVKAKEMSFQDFFSKLQSGVYNRPASKTPRGEFCEQIMFSEEDAAKIKSIDDFDANVAKLKSIRIRKVTAGGSFSGGTKAKYLLSIPIKARFATDITNGQVNYKDIKISSLTMYHPSPVRIENIQHDAILSLNDPSDADVDTSIDTVILIPLKGSNLGSESESFFNKIVKHIITISKPDDTTGLFQRIDIPTGADWNIKQVFWLGDVQDDGFAKVTDSYFSWMGASSYERYLKNQSAMNFQLVGGRFVFSAAQLDYGWRPIGKQVRYFMLGSPVNISLTDLSTLTRNMPPTPPDEAIHKIPDPTVRGNMRVLYKAAEGKAAQASCGVVRERMENPGETVGNLLFSDSTDFMTGADGKKVDSCDPFAMNANESKYMGFTPARAIAFFFNFLIVVGVLLGAWIGMYLVTLNYDNTYKQFAEDVGKVFGVWAKKSSQKVKDALPTMPKIPSIPKTEGLPDIEGLGDIKGLPDVKGLGDIKGLPDVKGLGDVQAKLPKGLGSFAKLLKK